MKITIDKTDYYYKDEGKGEIILLIHGNPDSADYWDGLISKLSPTYRCIALDLPGFGRSDIEDDIAFSLDYAQKWLQSFLDTIQISDPVHLIVHDIGAFYGLSWAITTPRKIKSICITNTLFFSDYRWHFWGRVWRTPILGELTAYLNNKWLFKQTLKKSSPKLSDNYLNKSFELNRSNPKTHATVLKIYRAMSPIVFKDWEDRYLTLTEQKPILVIWGDKDPFIPLKFGYAERMANGQTVRRISDAGHWAAAEVPELFASYWQAFIKPM